MVKKMDILMYSIIILCLTTFFITIFNPLLYIDYLNTFIIFITLTIFIYICGLVMNKENNYKRNITIYFILYFIMLFSLTMIMRNYRFQIISIENIHDYFCSINLVPFKTINGFINDGLVNRISFYNIFGNLVALMPLSFLLMIKSDKNINIKQQLLKISLTVLVIEVLQFIIDCGVFDIDDFILNIGGSILLYLLLSKTKLIYKIKKLFYTDFKLSNQIKYILLTIATIVEIIIIMLLIHDLVVL